MKPTSLFASLAALTVAASSASAQSFDDHARRPTEVVPVRDHRDDRYDRSDRDLRDRRYRRHRAPEVSAYAPISGPAGTLVTISGRNFGAGAVVVYDGVLVTPTQLSATSLTFAVPGTSGDGAISLRQDGFGDLAVGPFDLQIPVVERPGRDWSDWNRGRSGRRGDHIRGIRGRWQRAFLASPAVQAELTRHAERSARLSHMNRIATRNGNRPMLERIDALVARENARHERAMKKLEAEFRS